MDAASEAKPRNFLNGEEVDPASYYFRMNPMFETSSAKYDQMNRAIAICRGHGPADGPIYGIFEVL